MLCQINILHHTFPFFFFLRGYVLPLLNFGRKEGAQATHFVLIERQERRRVCLDLISRMTGQHRRAERRSLGGGGNKRERDTGKWRALSRLGTNKTRIRHGPSGPSPRTVEEKLHYRITALSQSKWQVASGEPPSLQTGVGGGAPAL